jgi:hypothetical protein
MYYVITDLGYDGMIVNEFEEESEALERYSEMDKDVPVLHEGVALIKGELIKANRLEFD